MKNRITMETTKQCLGKLDHHGEFDPEEKQIGIDLYKCLDVYVEPLKDRKPEFLKRIFEKFCIIHEARRELVETLKEGTKNFEGDETMKDFYNEYSELFKRTKDNDLNESFMDWDDKYDGDDNDNNDNNNEDGTPMTDENPGAEDQNENQNEKKDGDDGQTEKTDGRLAGAEVQSEQNMKDKETDNQTVNEKEKNDDANLFSESHSETD
ncbi:hypothetical protein Tco_0494958 [Tanacetum coccineum]